ncbi:MAG: transposase, partial [Bacilli bacterium]|nr:transposase [Bacilli bacterium]
HYWIESSKMIKYFIQKFEGSLLRELNEIARTFSNWFDEIVNAYAKTSLGFCVTNAVAEANNNTIQTLIDVGYGYGNFERLRNRVLYINRNMKTNPE